MSLVMSPARHARSWRFTHLGFVDNITLSLSMLGPEVQCGFVFSVPTACEMKIRCIRGYSSQAGGRRRAIRAYTVQGVWFMRNVALPRGESPGAAGLFYRPPTSPSWAHLRAGCHPRRGAGPESETGFRLGRRGDGSEGRPLHLTHNCRPKIRKAPTHRVLRTCGPWARLDLGWEGSGVKVDEMLRVTWAKFLARPR